MILLAPDLGVLAEGVIEGRRTFANILKYVRMGTSSNFGNMLSMALASLVLPFLPLLPVQILLNNLFYDTSEIGIPFDNVDGEDLRRPRAWDLGEILRFTLVMGGVSSAFDLLTFTVLLTVFHADPDSFRTAWFIEIDNDPDPCHLRHQDLGLDMEQQARSGAGDDIPGDARRGNRNRAHAAGPCRRFHHPSGPAARDDRSHRVRVSRGGGDHKGACRPIPSSKLEQSLHHASAPLTESDAMSARGRHPVEAGHAKT